MYILLAVTVVTNVFSSSCRESVGSTSKAVPILLLSVKLSTVVVGGMIALN